MEFIDGSRTKHAIAASATDKMTCCYFVSSLFLVTLLFNVSWSANATLSCAIPSRAVINEVYVRGGDSFVEIKLTGEQVDVAGWVLCGSAEPCYPLNSGWLVNDPDDNQSLVSGVYPKSTYLSVTIDSNVFGGNARELVLFDSVAKTKVVDAFIAVKNNNSAMCNEPVFGNEWQVPASCGSCLVAQSNNHKDYSRVPDGIGDWINVNSDATRGQNNEGEVEALTLDHFLLNNPIVASTCEALPVTITARDQENNTLIDYTEQVVLTVNSGHGNWSLDPAYNSSGTFTPAPDSDDNGQVSYKFKASDFGVAHLLLTNSHADDNLTMTVTDNEAGVAKTGPMTNFSDNVFVITDGDPQTIDGELIKNRVVAGRDHSYDVTLWTKDPSSDDCSIASNYNSPQDLTAWLVRDGDDPAGLAPKVTGVALPDDIPVNNNVRLSFTAGRANFTLVTRDVGKYTVMLRDSSGSFIAGNIDGGSAVQTVRPFGIAFSAITGNNGANPAGDEGGAPSQGFVAAGEKFELTLGAYLYSLDDDSDDDRLPDNGSHITDNGETPAFNALTGVTVDAYSPVGVKGSLVGVTGLATGAVNYIAGQVTLIEVTYSEVGSINLTASVSDYLANGINLSAASGKIGRFYPDHFILSVTPAAEITETCAAGGFSYMGQDNLAITYRLKAMNGLSPAGVTQNYDNDTLTYAQTATIGYHAENDNSGNELNADNRLSVLIDPKWVNGEFIAEIANANFAKLATIDGPYHTLQLGISIDTELDGRGFTGGGTQAIGSTLDLRFGRAVLKNAFGPEDADLAMPIELQYYDSVGERFRLNSKDSCTKSLIATLPSSPPNPSVILSNDGLGSVLLTAPSTVGDIKATLAVDDWLKFDWDGDVDTAIENPTAIATFGRYRGNDRIIYWREVRQ